MWKWLVAAVLMGVLACSLLLACAGLYLPLDLLFNLVFGWVSYLIRTFPQVHVSGTGVLTAVACLGAIALGLQWFLRWFVGQMSSKVAPSESTVRSWPVRRTSVILGLVVMMFVAGLSMVGISHQVGWLLTSPEPIVESGMHEITGRWQSQNNLHQMALAMLSYQDIEKSLPPAASHDRQGQPLLSWRVRILPLIEEEELYQEFHRDEPWDSPHNLRLLPRMPKLYASPYRVREDKPFSTPYQVFVGKGAAFEGKEGLRVPDDFPDTLAKTVLIVEAAEVVPWTKPVDLPFDPGRPLPALGQSSWKVFPVALADGSVRTIDPNTSEATLRAAITRNGGEELGPDW